MPIPAEHNHEPPSGVSRRGLLRGVAWAAPAIVVATAAPSASASGDFSPFSLGNIQINWTNFTVYSVWANGDDWGGVAGNFKIQRINDDWNIPNTDITELTVTVTFETRLGLTGIPSEVAISGVSVSAGWTVQSVSIGATYTVFTFRWAGAMSRSQNTGILEYQIPTTIDVKENTVVPYTVSGYANGPKVKQAITALVSVTN